MANVSTDQVRSRLRTATSTKANFTTAYCMEKASSSGATVSSMKVNSQITESPATAFIDGLTPVFTKVR